MFNFAYNAKMCLNQNCKGKCGNCKFMRMHSLLSHDAFLAHQLQKAYEQEATDRNVAHQMQEAFYQEAFYQEAADEKKDANSYVASIMQPSKQETDLQEQREFQKLLEQERQRQEQEKSDAIWARQLTNESIQHQIDTDYLLALTFSQ
jgi:hypothetical protein